MRRVTRASKTALALVALLALPVLVWILLPPRAAPSAPSSPPRAGAPPASAAAAPPHREGPRVSGVVRGTVRGEDGAPIEGAQVRLRRASSVLAAPAARSDVGGRFRIVGAPIGADAVVVDKAGFGSGSAPLPGGPAALDQQVTVTLAASRGVGGVVVDTAGRPVAGAFVACDDRGDTLVGSSTGEDGRFALTNDALGCRAVARHTHHTSSFPITLGAGSDHVLRLQANGAIHGVVVDDRGEPVRPYVLSVASFVPADQPDAPVPGGKRHPIDDAAGRFALVELPAGRYVLTARAAGHAPATSELIEVTPGGDADRVRIALRAADGG